MSHGTWNLTWPLSDIIVRMKGNLEVTQKKILLPNICVQQNDRIKTITKICFILTIKRTISIDLIIQKAHCFPVHNFVKLTFAHVFRTMPKLCVPFTFASKHVFCVTHVANTLRQSFLQISKYDVNSRSKRTGKNFCFLCFDWRPVKMLIFVDVDFVTRYLAYYRIFGGAQNDFSCKAFLPVNIGGKKTVIWHIFNHAYGSLRGLGVGG